MRKIIFIILPLITAVVISSCEKLEDFGKTNRNQNATPTPITAALLTNSLSGLGGYTAITRQGLYCQYFSETQYTDVSLYSSPKLTSTGNYSGILMDLQNIINVNTDPATIAIAAKNGSTNNQIAVARILKAYVYWYITDSWGDVPYSEALKAIPNVAYDTQQAIYEGMLSELTAAVAQFDNGPTLKGDILYAGDVAKWKKFANSLRMLMAMRLTKVYPNAGQYAEQQFQAAVDDANGSIDVNADNAILAYVGGNFKNPFYNLYDGRKDFAISASMIANMPAGDTRLNQFAGASNDAATFVGVPYGVVRATAEAFTGANPNWGKILASSWRNETSPLVLLSASEVLLARAEAAQRGWTTENAQTLFQSGITRSFERWGITVPGTYDVTMTNLAEIHLQQYIASYPNGWFGYSNWRRTGVPTLTPAPDATNASGLIPRRYVYGDPELLLTPAGYEAAVARITGGDTQDSRVWWDQ
ncbi:MAG: SusD/RagB family nutrient-binding outer membrane lipoprotein [Tenuifilaceae bacterium]